MEFNDIQLRQFCVISFDFRYTYVHVYMIFNKTSCCSTSSQEFKFYATKTVPLPVFEFHVCLELIGNIKKKLDKSDRVIKYTYSSYTKLIARHKQTKIDFRTFI